MHIYGMHGCIGQLKVEKKKCVFGRHIYAQKTERTSSLCSVAKSFSLSFSKCWWELCLISVRFAGMGAISSFSGNCCEKVAEDVSGIDINDLSLAFGAV